MFYRKKPVVVEAYQLPDLGKGGPIDGWPAWLNRPGIVIGANDVLFVPTLEGLMQARMGDWIIKGAFDEVYPVKPHIFEATYEPVTDDPRW